MFNNEIYFLKKGTAYDLYVLADYAIENQLIKDIIHQ
jgi:hypothetical protein